MRHHPLNALVYLSYKQEHPLTVHNTTNTSIKLTLILHYNLILRPLLSINVVHRSSSQSHIASRQVLFLISFRIEQFWPWHSRPWHIWKWQASQFRVIRWYFLLIKFRLGIFHRNIPETMLTSSHCILRWCSFWFVPLWRMSPLTI